MQVMKGPSGNRRGAFAILEYVMLVTILMLALASFSTYIRRGLQGQYRKVGTSVAYGRQFAPHGTIDCAYDPGQRLWYAQACFDNKVLEMKCTQSADYDTCVNGVKAACTNGCQ